MKDINLKNLLFLLLIVNFTSCSNPQYKIVYENGNIKELGHVDKTKNPTGEWKYYYESGKLLRIGKYENGKKTGEWKDYLEDGTLLTTANFENGNSTGE